jgi:hypothetical protein
MSPMSPRTLRPRQTGFNPASIAGLIAWYDAADTKTLGPTSSGVGTVSNNGPVKYLQDKSGSGLHLTQTGADSVAPTFLSSSQNGLPALSFDGGDQISRASSEAMTGPFTLFIVAKANATGTTRACGVGPTRSIGPFATSNTQWGFFVADSGVKSFNVSATAASVLAITCTSGLAVVLYGNGTQAESGTAGTLTPSGFSLGADQASGASTINGLIYECLSYNSVLSSSSRKAVEKYLGKKWGITVA